MASGDPALHRAVLPLVRVLGLHGHRRVRHPLHRSIPVGSVQLQRRCSAVELACGVLYLLGARNRSVPAIHPGQHRLSGRLRRGVSRAAVARIGAGQVVAAGDPTAAGPLDLHAAAPGCGSRPPSGTHLRAKLVGFSLLGLLVFIAAVILLFTGFYPRPLFDLVIGINRWVYRVIVYTSLMTDQYPPFRLDQGPHGAGVGARQPGRHRPSRAPRIEPGAS